MAAALQSRRIVWCVALVAQRELVHEVNSLDMGTVSEARRNTIVSKLQSSPAHFF